MFSSSLFVSESRHIAADPQKIFDIIADPAQHPLMDGSGSVLQPRPGSPARLSLNATFAMDMHIRRDYKITNTVVEFEEPTLIGWRHFNRHIWRYRLSAVDGGTLVTEEWDARRAKNRLGLVLLRFGNRNRAGIITTLEKLETIALAR